MDGQVSIASKEVSEYLLMASSNAPNNRIQLINLCLQCRIHKAFDCLVYSRDNDMTESSRIYRA